MRFSEKFGYKPVRQIIQIDSMNDELKNALWNALSEYVWDEVNSPTHFDAFVVDLDIRKFSRLVWTEYFKRPIDEMPSSWTNSQKVIRQHFFESKWYNVYDFLEFVVERFPYADKAGFIATCNQYLERESSAYRLVDEVFVRITDETEISEIEQALNNGQNAVRTHLGRSLELLSNRDSPDYRNSIKESISAVESLVSITLGKKGTLGDLLKKLDKEIRLHPAMKSAFSSLYGYTSDEGGIRHAIMESSEIHFEDAKFFLVVCSAFVNFVTAGTATKANAT